MAERVSFDVGSLVCFGLGCKVIPFKLGTAGLEAFSDRKYVVSGAIAIFNCGNAG